MSQKRWQSQLAAYPYAQPLVIGWQVTDYSGDLRWCEYEKALEEYMESQDDSLPVGKRYESLVASLDRFGALAAKGDGHIGTRLALIRLNIELNETSAAMDAIQGLLQAMPWLAEKLPTGLRIQINRPFLPPIRTYDSRPVEGELAQWLQSAILEAMEHLENGE